MDKIIESRELDITDLGAVSVETKGGPSGVIEPFGLQPPTGLSSD